MSTLQMEIYPKPFLTAMLWLFSNVEELNVKKNRVRRIWGIADNLGDDIFLPLYRSKGEERLYLALTYYKVILSRYLDLEQDPVNLIGVAAYILYAVGEENLKNLLLESKDIYSLCWKFLSFVTDDFNKDTSKTELLDNIYKLASILQLP